MTTAERLAVLERVKGYIEKSYALHLRTRTRDNPEFMEHWRKVTRERAEELEALQWVIQTHKEVIP